jgi:microcystin-dependent protein
MYVISGTYIGIKYVCFFSFKKSWKKCSGDLMPVKKNSISDVMI